MSQQRKFFPGWLVVASGFVIMATCYTIFVNCMSLFQPLIVSDLGITLAQYNVSNAISTVVSVVGSLVIGHVADKVSGRVLGSLTVIATSAVLAGMSFVGELWQVYVLFAVSGCFAVASTRLLISLVTANWFTAKRGLAISIALSGSGFGGAILSPIVSSLIVSVGWRSAFLVLAAICMVAALPITAYSFRTKPSEIGLKPLGENPGDPSVSTAGDKDEHTAPEVSVGWSRIKKSPAFWLLVVAFLFMGLVNGAILPNQVTNRRVLPSTALRSSRAATIPCGRVPCFRPTWSPSLSPKFRSVQSMTALACALAISLAPLRALSPAWRCASRRRTSVLLSPL